MEVTVLSSFYREPLGAKSPDPVPFEFAADKC